MSELPVDLRPREDREMLLLIECARASVEPDRAARIHDRVTAGLDWGRLSTLAQRNGLAPLLYCHLSQICPTSVPADVFQSLRDYFLKNSAFALLLTGELVRLLSALSDHGIEGIPYKGPAMAAQLYGNVARRQFCDLDVLVKKCDVWEASRVIEAQGFAPLLPVPETMRARYLDQAYVRLFQRDAGRAIVELHWGIAEPYWGVAFDADELWPRLEPMSLQGLTICMPGREDLLLMLCVHAGRHGSDKLEGVGSIAELLRTADDFDWERVWQRAREIHCRRMLELGLLLAHGLFDVPLPPQAAGVSRSRMLLAMARQAVRNFSDPQPRTWRSQVAFHLRLNDSSADMLRHCLRLGLSTPDDRATVRLPGALSFAYPIVRVVRLMRRHGLH